MKRILQSTGIISDKAIRNIAGFLLLVLFLSSLTDVINRIFIGESLPWSHTLSVWCAIIYSFLLIGPLIWDRSHIKVDIILTRLKGVARYTVETFFTIAIIAFSAILIYSAAKYIPILIRMKFTAQIGKWYIPFWPIMLASVGVGMGIAAIYAVVTLIHDIRTRSEITASKEIEEVLKTAEETVKEEQ